MDCTFFDTMGRLGALLFDDTSSGKVRRKFKNPDN